MEMKTLNTTEINEFCDNIKLVDFNQIQPHGVLLALDLNLNIIQYSENISALLETSVNELLTHSITHFLNPILPQDDIPAWLRQSTNQYKKMIWQTPKNKLPIFTYIYRNSDMVILEIERDMDNYEGNNALIDLTQYINSSIQDAMQCKSMLELSTTTCKIIQVATGYHRVIIYKFNNHDQSGTVVGEVLDGNMESYLGLRFPANDVPQAVRDMYLKLPLRYIPTILEQPVKILPRINPLTKEELDLSNLNLRMVAPVHVEYLTNMKVVSATSIAIIQDKKLWGLIACHHKNGKFLSLHLRLALLLIANTFATQILMLESATDFREEQRTVALQTKMTSHLSKTDTLSYEHYSHEFMELTSATGMSVYFHGVLQNYGETPTNGQVMNLVKWLKMKKILTSYATNTLPLEYEPSMDYKSKACGILAIKITTMDNYIIFYKPELIGTVIWAGKPTESLKFSRNSYSPRDSFERFLQTIHNQSAPWTHSDLNSADFIRSIVANKQLQDLLQLQATHDPLTTLLNRSYLEHSLSLEIQRASRQNKTLSVILLDLDFFKKINDNYGHQAGDTVLVEFSKFLKKHLREYDYIYRYGGEEFFIILPDNDSSSALKKAELLRVETKKLKIKFDDSDLPSLCISLGVSTYPENGLDSKSLIASADEALLRAKDNGRDQVAEALSS